MFFLGKAAKDSEVLNTFWWHLPNAILQLMIVFLIAWNKMNVICRGNANYMVQGAGFSTVPNWAVMRSSYSVFIYFLKQYLR